MDSIPRPRLSKIPGEPMPLAKENHKQDLSKLTNLELLDMKNREELLLKNKARLDKLPDKGKKIYELYEKVKAELERRSSVDEAAAMFSELNIVSTGKTKLNEMEWQGSLNGNNDADPSEDVLDSDDEAELDPLRILAQRTMHVRKVRHLPEEKKLITQKDLEEIESFSRSEENAENESTDTASEGEIDTQLVSVDILTMKTKLKDAIRKVDGDPKVKPKGDLEELEKHALYVVSKTENPAHTPSREKFKPYKTTISNVHDPDKERMRKQGKHWEITAATPPPIQHKGTQMLSLLDSVQLQTEYLDKMKELQEQQAEERLAAKMKRLATTKIQLPSEGDLLAKPSFTQYRVRLPNIEGEQNFHEVVEIEDTDDDKKHGGVIYTVFE